MKKIFFVLVVFILSCQKPPAELIDEKGQYLIFSTNKMADYCLIPKKTFKENKICECAEKLQKSEYSILPSKLTGLEKTKANQDLIIKYWEGQFKEYCSFDYLKEN